MGYIVVSSKYGTGTAPAAIENVNGAPDTSFPASLGTVVSTLTRAQIAELRKAGYEVLQTTAAGFTKSGVNQVSSYSKSDSDPGVPTYTAPANLATAIVITHNLTVDADNFGQIEVHRIRAGADTIVGTGGVAVAAAASPQSITMTSAAATGDIHYAVIWFGGSNSVTGAQVTT